MARLVYLPSVEPASWLLWTTRGVGSCLRDFRVSPTREMRDRTTGEIEALLTAPGHYWEMAEEVSYKDDAFWRERISLKNVESGLPAVTAALATGGKQRLLSMFTAEVTPLLSENRAADLAAAVRRWADGFTHVVDKVQFNHWDNSDATGRSTPTTGFGWTSTILEYCREGGALRYVRTGRADLDFAVIAAEVSFGLSSKDNPFQPGHQDYIEPDGIGVREAGGSLLVLEVKGPQDDHDLLAATLQAFCGALAVYAKRGMVVGMAGLAGAAGGRRPAVAAELPDDRRSLGLYVLVVLKAGEQVRGDDLARLGPAVGLLRAAFPPLRDAVYFIVREEQLADIGSLRPTAVYP